MEPEKNNFIVDVLESLDMMGNFPNILYQYTDSCALQGMKKENELWATGWRFLNDENEYMYGFELLKKHLKKNGNKYNKLRSFIEDVDKMKVAQDIEMLGGICCFSENGDLLSQWRGYGKGYNSVSIGFNMHKLSHYLTDSPQGPFLGKVIYDEVRQNKILDVLLTRINEKCDKPTFGDVAAALYFVLLFFKEECWKEEAEWRLLSFGKNNDIKFRTGNLGLIPYLPLKVFKDNVEGCIEEIIIPRSKYFDRSRYAIEIFMPSLKEKIKPSAISIDYGFTNQSR